jgi:hypothetical protein
MDCHLGANNDASEDSADIESRGSGKDTNEENQASSKDNDEDDDDGGSDGGGGSKEEEEEPVCTDVVSSLACLKSLSPTLLHCQSKMVGLTRTLTGQPSVMSKWQMLV